MNLGLYLMCIKNSQISKLQGIEKTKFPSSKSRRFKISKFRSFRSPTCKQKANIIFELPSKLNSNLSKKVHTLSKHVNILDSQICKNDVFEDDLAFLYFKSIFAINKGSKVPNLVKFWTCQKMPNRI